MGYLRWVISAFPHSTVFVLEFRVHKMAANLILHFVFWGFGFVRWQRTSRIDLHGGRQRTSGNTSKGVAYVGREPLVLVSGV